MTNTEQERKVGIVKEIAKRVFKFVEEGKIKKVLNISSELHSEIKNRGGLEEDYNYKNNENKIEIKYRKMIWGEIPYKIEPLISKELPLKLYCINSENDVEKSPQDNVKESKACLDIKYYATLSYVWGSSSYNKKINKLSCGGKKSLVKAIDVCNYFKVTENLDIKYLWMDQLCIDQDNNEEKAQEVKKMGQYYENSHVTLVSINTKIGEEVYNLPEVLKKIVRSKWFTRSWTFQEAWLSRWIVFMFDDYLVDGRAVACMWAKVELKTSIKVATPVGKTYFERGYSSDEKVDLRLNEALRAIKDKKRTKSLDGVYSILGLLPYGNDEKIKIDYSESNTPEKALINVMEVAVKEGYGEPLAWYGGSDSWLPQIDEYGSTTVEGGIEIKCKKFEKNIVFQKNNAIKVFGSKYVIDSIHNDEETSEGGGDLIDSGVWKKKIFLKVDNKSEELTLQGTKKSFEMVKDKDILLIFNKKKWEIDKNFALLVSREKSNCQRIGLVEVLSNRIEKLQKKVNESQIEIPPK